MAADGGEIAAAGGRDKIRGDGGVGDRRHFHVGETAEKTVALADGLLMGDDFADVVHFHARQGE